MRLPLTPQVSTKDGAANKNARLMNMLREKDKAVVRPGLSLVLDYAGLGHGLVPFNDSLIGIFDDTVYDLDASGTPAASGGGGVLDLTTVDATPVALDFADWDVGFTYPIGWKVMYTGIECTSLQNGNVGNTPSEGSQWWLGIGSGQKATGGAVTTDGAYTIHTFTADGTFTVLLAPLIVDYLIVGGGGASDGEGGGGAGGLSYVTDFEIPDAGPNAVTVGIGVPSDDTGTEIGGSTTFITTVIGGGSGGMSGDGGNGACGGGGGTDPIGGSAIGGTGSVGFNGGSGVVDLTEFGQAGGGGGGMGADGGNGSLTPGDASTGIGGDGGDGVQNGISGTLEWYAGGGAGGGDVGGTPGQGFLSAGGGGNFNAGPGTDGIVIIKYLS